MQITAAFQVNCLPPSHTQRCHPLMHITATINPRRSLCAAPRTNQCHPPVQFADAPVKMPGRCRGRLSYKLMLLMAAAHVVWLLFYAAHIITIAPSCQVRPMQMTEGCRTRD